MSYAVLNVNDRGRLDKEIAMRPNTLRFDHSADEMSQLTDAMIERGEKMLDALVAIPDEEKTYNNSMLPLIKFNSDFSTFSNNIRFYRYVAMDEDQKKASIELE